MQLLHIRKLKTHFSNTTGGCNNEQNYERKLWGRNIIRNFKLVKQRPREIGKISLLTKRKNFGDDRSQEGRNVK